MKSVIWTDFLASLALVFGLLYSISAAMHSVATTDNPQYSNITGASARMWDIAKKSDKVWTEGFWDANPLYVSRLNKLLLYLETRAPFRNNYLFPFLLKKNHNLFMVVFRCQKKVVDLN